jgi:hypothetical protein
MLGTTSDRRFDDLALISFVLSTSMTGPVQALLATFATSEVVTRVQENLVAMAIAYVRQVGST